MFELLDKIAQANEFEIESLMKAVQQRTTFCFRIGKSSPSLFKKMLTQTNSLIK